MPELESLTSRANELSSKVDFWNNAVLLALLVTAVGAVFLVVSQRLAFVRGKALSEVQDRIGMQLRTDLSKQQEQTATAQKELLELKERMKDRHLTPEEQKRVSDKLKAFAGQKILIVGYNGEEEQYAIAREIVAALGPESGAGWNVNPIYGGQPIEKIRGVIIEIEPNSSRSVQEAANALASALRVEHLAVTGPEEGAGKYVGRTERGVAQDGDKTKITMTIGKKP